MTTRPFGPSYECGRRLVDAGCPLDHLELLPRNLAAYRKRLHVRKLTGFESRIVDLGGRGTGYLIGVAVGTDLACGNIITDWRFVLPWEQHITWDRDPDQIAPLQEREFYGSLFNPRLPRVLNERRLLTRGRPVEGLLCGHTLESIPESFRRHPMIDAKLSLTDDTGFRIALRIQLMVDRSAARDPETPKTKLRRLFDCPDPKISSEIDNHKDNIEQPRTLRRNREHQRDIYVTGDGTKVSNADAGESHQPRRSGLSGKRANRPGGAEQPPHR